MINYNTTLCKNKYKIKGKVLYINIFYSLSLF